MTVPTRKSPVSSTRPCLISDAASLRAAFQEALTQSSDVHLAVAWMRSGWALDEICNAGVRVHAVLGTSFGMTEPTAIERLMECEGSSVRVVDDPDDGGIFHPKLYCFSKGMSGTAIVGSMNLTRAAFSENCELGVQLTLTANERLELLKVWATWNDRAIEPTRRWLDKYQELWAKRSKATTALMAQREDGKNSQESDTHGLTKHEVLNYSWRSFEQMLRSHAKKRDASYDIIFDPRGSYLAAIHLAGPLLNEPLPAPSTPAFRSLTGRLPIADDPQVDCGWLGRLSASGNGIAALGNNTDLRRKIERLIPALHAAETSDDKLDAAKRFWDAMTSFPYVSHAAVTRFCALARPDSFYSLNQRSIEVLSQIFEMSKNRLTSWDGYAHGLQAFWSSPWWQSEPPKAKASRQMWDARVALIDVLAYTPPE
ncbi:MAG: hypothetical protein CMJ31_11305 [Phycisphaerae bacterium]|nr:hypothetical protein [Phycisphaerae bacterium]